MNKPVYPRRSVKILLPVFLVLSLTAGCLPVFAAPKATPVIQTVMVTQVVTQEVTRIVEVPVTVTPSPTPIATDTPLSTPTDSYTPTNTPIPEPAAVTVLIHTQCLYGPDPAYMSKYEILADSQQVVIGRNQDGSWLYVEGSDHKDPCWVKAQIVRVDKGSIAGMPLTDPVLAPYSSLYTPPQAVSVNRVDSAVTIFWLPIPMSETDYEGYLIEAWVCQSGQLVFTPTGFVPLFSKNNDTNFMAAVKITDEAGCDQPSTARIYSVSKQGYSNYKTINLPAWLAASPTLTKTP